MPQKRFDISHSVIGVAALLLLEALMVSFVEKLAVPSIMIGALVGGMGIVVVATDVVEEVRESKKMLALLAATVLEFIVFFAFQYHFLFSIDPESFQGLVQEPVTLLLQSTMVFALNPLYMPMTVAGKMLLLLNTIESLVLALFVLQNIWQLHRMRD